MEYGKFRALIAVLGPVQVYKSKSQPRTGHTRRTEVQVYITGRVRAELC